MDDPVIHPHQQLLTPAGEAVSIDIEMVPVITPLWRLGMTTTACCQDVGEATRAVRDAKPPQAYRAEEFIAYYNGYALLKMPVQDALRLITLLAGTAVFGSRVSRRWLADSWRINVPVTYEDTAASLAPEALLHFPKIQIKSLARELDRMCKVLDA